MGIPRRLLLEGDNLTLPTGTGIATYARVLGRTAQQLGWQVDVLVGTPRRLDTKDPLLAEIGLHDASSGREPFILERLFFHASRLALSPSGLRPTSIRASGAVLATTGGPLGQFDRIHAVRDLSQLARVFFKTTGRPLRVKLETPPDLFHATHPLAAQVVDCPNIYTIHDLVPLRLPHTTLDDKRYFLDMVREIAKRADHIVTVSEFSRRDIVSLLGVSEDRVTNTYQAVHLPEALLARSRSDIAVELANSFGLELGGYYLFLGAIEPKKNVSRLIDAFAAAGSKRPLVIVGGDGWQSKADLEKIKDDRFLSYTIDGQRITQSRRVRRLQYLPFSQLVALMRGARAVLFPSLYEGFGLPVLEAMLAGTPVLTSTAASLPEVAGDAALLVDPNDVDDITAGIRALDSDDDLCADLVARGHVQAAKFTPAAYAQRIAALYQQVTGSPRTDPAAR
jgi:glycosyltransferase involved in cell wall biosynthesis